MNCWEMWQAWGWGGVRNRSAQVCCSHVAYAPPQAASYCTAVPLPDLERSHLTIRPGHTIRRDSGGGIMELVILLLADEDASLVQGLGARGTLHVSGRLCILGLPR
jgi:hypothetical protein